MFSFIINYPLSSISIGLLLLVWLREQIYWCFFATKANLRDRATAQTFKAQVIQFELDCERENERDRKFGRMFRREKGEDVFIKLYKELLLKEYKMNQQIYTPGSLIFAAANEPMKEELLIHCNATLQEKHTKNQITVATPHPVESTQINYVKG